MDNYILTDDKEILTDDKEIDTPIPFPKELVKNSLKFQLKKNTKFPGIIARIEKEIQVI